MASSMLTGVLSIRGVLSKISPSLIHLGIVDLGTGPVNVIFSRIPSFLAKFLASSRLPSSLSGPIINNLTVGKSLASSAATFTASEGL